VAEYPHASHVGRQYGHVIDPRTGWPIDAARSAVVTGPGSLECDALSTALLVLGADWLPTLRARFPGYAGAAYAPVDDAAIAGSVHGAR
jgi:thiamine biosynthesis lipoprotein ApbE